MAKLTAAARKRPNPVVQSQHYGADAWMAKPVLSLPITYYTREDIVRIANTPCDECGKALRNCRCPDDYTIGDEPDGKTQVLNS